MRLYSTFVFYIHQVSHHKEIPASYKTDFRFFQIVKEHPAWTIARPGILSTLLQRHLKLTHLPDTHFACSSHNPACFQASCKKTGGAKRDRTADLLRARQALSQLSYSP